MKKYLILFSALMTVAISCDDRLDVKPQQNIEQSVALSTEKDVLVTLIGCYDGLQLAGTYGGDMMVLSELAGNSDDITFTGTFQGLAEAWATEMVSNNNNALVTWRDAYIVVNRCNFVLSALDKITSSTATRNRVEGEALFIRASMFFELVRLYAKAWDDGNNATNPGIPIVLEPTLFVTQDDYAPRNSVSEVYAKVLTDLTRAELLLPPNNGSYASKWAAVAQIARVKLMQGAIGSTPAQLTALQEARDAANRVIASGEYVLSATIGDNWFTFINNGGESPAEYVFSIKQTPQDGFNALNNYFGVSIDDIPGTSGRGDCEITTNHLDRYEPGDERGEYFIDAGGATYTLKHLDQYGNVPVIRLAEMYLIRAETNFRLNTIEGDSPINDINRIRNRAGLADLVGPLTIDDIWRERELELAFEGSRLHDIKRTRRTASGGLLWNSPTLVFPIPQREIDVNKALVQNQGY